MIKLNSNVNIDELIDMGFINIWYDEELDMNMAGLIYDGDEYCGLFEINDMNNAKEEIEKFLQYELCYACSIINKISELEYNGILSIQCDDEVLN